MTHLAMTSRYMSAFVLVCIAASSLAAQTSKHANSVLATVGSEKVLYKDVERAFQKNLTRRSTSFSEVPRDTALDFLHLYTNYRLKVASARERELDKDPAVKADINNNRKLLSETWYFDEMFANDRIEELAKRKTRELKIAIILCAIRDPETKQWDTVGSMNKGKAIVKLLNSGASFVDVARDSSDDAETGKNGGVLPWISGGSIIKSVEDEAYRLNVGEYSKTPVVTQFGYFLVTVLKSEPREVVSFRHILLQAQDDRDSVATAQLARKLLSVINTDPETQAAMMREYGLEGAEDTFSALAKKFSNDKTSADKGGDLGSKYSRSGGMEKNGSRLVGEFEDGVFALKDGEVSGIVNTVFGIHIIRRDSTFYPDPQQERDNAKRTYRRLYFEDDKRTLFDSLKTANGYGWNNQGKAKFVASIDTTKNTSDTAWWRKIDDATMAQELYNLRTGSITVKSFTDSLRQRLDLKGYTLNEAGFDRAMNKIVDPIVLEEATENLSNTYPDFADLLQEFNDGILLFKVEEQEVWSKLKFDTSDAKVFYDTTKSRWMTEERYQLSEIYVLTEADAMRVSNRLKSGEPFGDVAADLTVRQGGREKNGSLGVLSAKTSEIARKVDEASLNTGEVMGPFKVDDGISFIRLDQRIAPKQRTFEQALNDLAPAYQDALQTRLTEVWLSDVRKRFPVKLNTDTIDSIW